MAIGVFAVLVNVTACVVNIVRGLGFMQSVCDFLSLFAVCLAMYAFYWHKKLVDRYTELANDVRFMTKTMLDRDNKIGKYNVIEYDDRFGVHKDYENGLFCFVVRTLPFTEGDDTSRKKARLRAYSLLNHITDNGKLWKQESTEK